MDWLFGKKNVDCRSLLVSMPAMFYSRKNRSVTLHRPRVCTRMMLVFGEPSNNGHVGAVKFPAASDKRNKQNWSGLPSKCYCLSLMTVSLLDAMF